MKQAADKAINEKAVDKGIAKEKRNIARALLKKEISVDIIAETTGSSVEEIDDL